MEPYFENRLLPKNEGNGDVKRLDNEGMSAFVQQNDCNLAITHTVYEVAAQIGCSSAQVALSWLLHQGTIV